MFSGPYSYCKSSFSLLIHLLFSATAPIELLFGRLKFGTLCDAQQKSGKK